VYYNTATRNANGANYSGGTLNYCCTTPMPPNGQGNITLDPQLASASHLSADSPCIAAGSAAYATGTDTDGEAWASPPSIGCDEYHAGAVTGPLSVSLVASYTTVAAGYSVGLTAVIGGRTTASVWDFGDGVIVSNRPYASHAWTGAGDYTVVLRAFNDSHPDGVSANVTIHVVAQPVHYVAATSTAAQPPYTNWATASATIQDAVDAATMTGALVLVTNGTYAAGGRAVHGATGNRVTVDKPLVLRSVNGPQFTVIQGHQVPGATNGDGAFRCVYLTNGASLSGFTLTQGATRGNVGDVWERSGGGIWCEPLSAVVSNCILAGNSADWAGGGAYQGTLNNCQLSGNTGFGAVYATLNNCTLTGNSGGGAYSSSLNNCVLTGNFDYGVSSSTLNNCTLTGNVGGGALFSTLNNCILYSNTGLNSNYLGCTLNYCCTTPDPGGVGNISLDPQLASASHLSAASPCRGAGSAVYASGTDIDGEAWANPPSIGCDEYHVLAVTGPLSVVLLAPFTNVAAGYPLGFTALIDGRTVASVWDFGDGLVVSNRPYATHAWTTAGDYAVILWAYNESHPEGVTASVTVHVASPVHYVSAASPNPLPPYTNWATAALTIQDAVDAAVAPGALVLVTNGTYASGGRAVGTNVLVNRVAVTKPLTVRSVNGPQVTVIRGYQVSGTTNGNSAVRCVYLTDGASLSGFTLIRGATLTNWDSYLNLSGGGVCCDSTNALITNCVLIANSAYNDGGGAYGGTLNNCTLTRNWTWMFGGGACGSTLNCCTVTGNSADSGGGARAGILNNCVVTGNAASGFDGFGGGAEYCTLNNCTVVGNWAAWEGGGASGVMGSCILKNSIIYQNTAAYAGNNCAACGLSFCCTDTCDPLFADSSLRLQSNSPCINTGNNAYVTTSTDLDGRPRIVGGTVDIGAYEFQGPFNQWLQQYGLPTDGSADFIDSDGDGMNNWQEWLCGTCPTNALSALRLLSPQRTETNVTVTWQSVPGVNYFLECSTNLSATPCFTCVATNVPGQPGATRYTDSTAANAGPYFYRVGVGN
jgi:PKD repeat protein